jgi:Uma2 family endonuclease
MAEPAERAWTLNEFFAWQELQPDRYELVNGRPLRMMAGAKNVHDDIVVNALLALGPQLRSSGCRPFTGDGAVETYPGQIRRPDVGVDYGRRNPDGYKAEAPRLVMEVLSPSTRDFDSIRKLEEYKSVAGLNYILFVEPNAPFVSMWSRAEAGDWREARVAGLDAKADLPALGASLDLRALYDGVVFPAEPRFVTFEAPR